MTPLDDALEHGAKRRAVAVHFVLRDEVLFTGGDDIDKALCGRWGVRTSRDRAAVTCRECLRRIPRMTEARAHARDTGGQR